MPYPMKDWHEYAEARLGRNAEDEFLRKVVSALGYSYKGPRKLTGRSGLEHEISGVGTRDKNMLLVFTSTVSRDDDLRRRADTWTRDALLKTYDVASVMEAEKMNVDLLYLENTCTKGVPSIQDMSKRAEGDLLRGFEVSIRTSVDPIPKPEVASSRQMASSMGACFMTLDDMTVPEIAGVLSDGSLDQARKLLDRLRIAQYFNPPADELILTAASLAPNPKSDLPQLVHNMALELAHAPSKNVIVTGVDYNNPIEIAKALQSEGLLTYEATMTLKEPGREIVHKIQKTPQENFVIRLLKALDVPGLAKSIIEGLKGS